MRLSRCPVPTRGRSAGHSSATGFPRRPRVGRLRRIGGALTILAVGAGVLASAAQAGTAHRPIGAVQDVRQGVGGIHLAGWAIDPDVRSAIEVAITVDGRATSVVSADRPNPATVAEYPAAGAAHGFDVTVATSAGTRRVCLTATDVDPAGAAPGTATALGCYSVLVDFSATGQLWSVPRPSGSTTITVHGWAADPETDRPVSVLITIDHAPAVQLRADLDLHKPWVPYSGMSLRHRFRAVFPATATAHVICAAVVNVGLGQDRSLGCRTSAALTPSAPDAPRSATARTLDSAAQVSWRAPASLAVTPVTSYTVTSTPDRRTVSVAAGALTATVTGLIAGRRYTFAVTAVNARGASAPSVATAAIVPTALTIGPVISPALISTSRYIRNITGGPRDVVRTWAMGATDASNNPSNHRYLTLLQIGGQTTTGIVLSATSTFVTYAAAVTALESYIDGYASAQHSNAPARIAIGTNNDMDVRRRTGILWATEVVTPLRKYARRYDNIRISGANDIEPGFLGTAHASKRWLKGYLGATTAKFVFNGSADGCGWRRVKTHCNNGWMSGNLQWLSGGADPKRIRSLPQIYNTTMSVQWKYISLTGIARGRHKVRFAGPLTEWTACYTQHGGCGSLPNNDAWTALWTQLRSDARISQHSLPYGTDLRIN